MDKSGPIVIIDDDIDDQEFIRDLLPAESRRKEIVVFSEAGAALEFLRRPEVKPFLILSEVKLPKTNGFELRQIIFDDDELRHKCVPYIFMTSGITPEVTKTAYGLSIQGVFEKPVSIDEWRDHLLKIVEYWQQAKSPNR